ncbi:MAG: hypothetical protein KDA25_01640 [Phycisphaerales bacterium]|nr:hypothetical protein [Phycisphaerales bacterium]
MMSLTLAWTPFLEPVGWVHTWWYLLIVPLSFGLGMMYKPMRMSRFDRYWREVGIFVGQVTLGVIAMGIALAVLTEFVLPLLPAE